MSWGAGGGLVQQSPDGKYGLSISGDRRYVDIALLTQGNEKLIFSYRHDANDLRHPGNVIEWSEDSAKVTARYHDIINGEDVIMEFNYNVPTACWNITKKRDKKQESF